MAIGGGGGTIGRIGSVVAGAVSVPGTSGGCVGTVGFIVGGVGKTGGTVTTGGAVGIDGTIGTETLGVEIGTLGVEIGLAAGKAGVVSTGGSPDGIVGGIEGEGFCGVETPIGGLGGLAGLIV